LLYFKSLLKSASQNYLYIPVLLPNLLFVKILQPKELERKLVSGINDTAHRWSAVSVIPSTTVVSGISDTAHHWSAVSMILRPPQVHYGFRRY
jgi:hypothetical protein